MTKMLSKSDILAAADLKTETVDVPEWGGSVVVRTMTGADRGAFEAAVMMIDASGKRQPDMRNMRAKLCVATVIDEAGNRLFDESDIGELQNKSSAALDAVFKAAQRLNGMAPESLEDAEKNSVAALGGVSPSA